MAINKLSQLLDQIQGYVANLKSLKAENEELKTKIAAVEAENAELKANINSIEAEIKATYEGQIVELETQKATLEAQIVALGKDIEVLKEQENLNLDKAQKIVEELKVIINAQ